MLLSNLFGGSERRRLGIKTMNISYQDIVDYWYSEQVKALWFNSNKAFDEELKERFEAVYQSAVNFELDHWKDEPQGALALAILFDQIPLNIYRDQPESFATEARAREVAAYAIDKGLDEKLTKEQKVFLYMPYMHSENLDDQETGIRLFEKAGLMENAKYAKHHRAIVEKFGRFPHRNKILNRESSEVELEYLASDEAFLG